MLDPDKAPEKWPELYERFCVWYRNRYKIDEHAKPSDISWEIFLAGWEAAGRSGAH